MGANERYARSEQVNSLCHLFNLAEFLWLRTSSCVPMLLQRHLDSLHLDALGIIDFDF